MLTRHSIAQQPNCSTRHLFIIALNKHTPDSQRQEADNILGLYRGDLSRAMGHLEQQLNTIHARAQVLVSLAGVVVTVTGFSGRIIAHTSALSQSFIIGGLFTVILAALWIFAKVMRLRWVTMDIQDDPQATILTLIRRRDKKTQAYCRGGLLLFLGILVYGFAVAIMLANPEPLTIPPR